MGMQPAISPSESAIQLLCWNQGGGKVVAPTCGDSCLSG